jgi:flagellar motor switch protein FliN/FliY
MPEDATKPQQDESFELLLDVPLRVTVELGQSKMHVHDLLDLAQGEVLELDRLAGEPVDILVNGRPVALGEIVVVNDRYGVRIVSVRSPTERQEAQD